MPGRSVLWRPESEVFCPYCPPQAKKNFGPKNSVSYEKSLTKLSGAAESKQPPSSGAQRVGRLAGWTDAHSRRRSIGLDWLCSAGARASAAAGMRAALLPCIGLARRPERCSNERPLCARHVLARTRHMLAVFFFWTACDVLPAAEPVACEGKIARFISCLEPARTVGPPLISWTMTDLTTA